MRFALDAATLAFGAWLADGRLVRAMQSDPYVLGYVVARLQGMVRHAAGDAGLGGEAAALGALAQRALFGDAADAVLAAATPSDGVGHERWMAGTDDGRAQCAYLFGALDVRDHPRYADAAQRERSAAAAMPDNRFNGSDAAVAHHLEHFTFTAYFERNHPLAAASGACNGVA